MKDSPINLGNLLLNNEGVIASKTHAELHSSYHCTSSWFKHMESDPDVASAIAKVMLTNKPFSFIVSELVYK